MKNILRLFVILSTSLILFSCADIGVKYTYKQIRKTEYKYYYNTNEYVLITRFKNNPNIIGTTWDEYDPVTKNTLTKSNIVIFENDTIKVVKK